MSILKLLPSALLLIMLIAFGEMIWYFEWVPHFLLPAPHEVLAVLIENQEILLNATVETLSSAAIGLSLAAAIGAGLAMLFVRFRFLGDAIFPFTILFQTVPVIAIAPLLVVWFGFGQTTVQVSALIVSIFPVLAGGLAGLRQTPKEYLELFASLEASPQQILWKLRVPLAIPSVLTGLQVASGLAVIGAIVGEFVAGTGLGSLIDSARTQQRVDLIFAAVFLAATVGLLFMILMKSLNIVFKNYLRGVKN
jgi:NitT/TauT family transport system permease protein